MNFVIIDRIIRNGVKVCRTGPRNPLNATTQCVAKTASKAEDNVESGKQRKKTMTRDDEVNGSSLSLHSQVVDLCYEA